MKRVLMFLLCAVLAILPLTSCEKSDLPLTVAQLLDLGEKYLLDLDYEQALVQFLEVIEIEPMNPRGYTGAADAYIGLDRLDDAIAILKKGLEVIGSDQSIESRIEQLRIPTIVSFSVDKTEGYVGEAFAFTLKTDYPVDGATIIIDNDSAVEMMSTDGITWTISRGLDSSGDRNVSARVRYRDSVIELPARMISSIIVTTKEEQIDKLWTDLSGIWGWVDDDGNVDRSYFIYYGYNDEDKPIFFWGWEYEVAETRYVTDIEVLNDSSYNVTYYVPEESGGGLFDAHDEFYETYNYDLSEYSSERVISTDEIGVVSTWEYVASTFDEYHIYGVA